MDREKMCLLLPHGILQVLEMKCMSRSVGQCYVAEVKIHAWYMLLLNSTI